jgi:hypothetical protein
MESVNLIIFSFHVVVGKLYRSPWAGFGLFFILIMSYRYVRLCCAKVYPLEVRESKFKKYTRTAWVTASLCVLGLILMSAASSNLRNDANNLMV